MCVNEANYVDKDYNDSEIENYTLHFDRLQEVGIKSRVLAFTKNTLIVTHNKDNEPPNTATINLMIKMTNEVINIIKTPPGQYTLVCRNNTTPPKNDLDQTR